jgi:hypothetical protein
VKGPELVARVRDARPLVADLARALSLSASIDVALVRGMRTALFDHADVTTETDLWSSPLIQTRSGTELSLRGDVLAALWDELGERREELDRCWSVLERLRPPGRPLRRLEELLTRLAIEGDRAGIDASLSSVVNAMLESSARRRDLAAWSARALARLPALVRECEAARILGSAAASWVATPKLVAHLTPLPENARLAYLLHADHKHVQISIRRRGDTLEVGRSLPEPRVTIDIPLANPQLIIDEDATHAIDLRTVTQIPVARPDVMIGTSDGRRFLLVRERSRPNAAAIARILGEEEAGVAYLVASNLAVSSARQLKESIYHLSFKSQMVRARVVSLDTDADIALLELASPLSIAPLELQVNVRKGDAWQALEAVPSSTPEQESGSISPRRWSGTVGTAWPQVILYVAKRDDRELVRPGMPIFVGDKVIAHLRSDTLPAAELHTTSARLIEWWLAQQARLGRAAEGVDHRRFEAPPRIWIATRATSEAPELLKLGTHPAAADDFVLLFAGERGREWPAGLYRATSVVPVPPSGIDWYLLVALPRPSEEGMLELGPRIQRLVSAPEGRDTRSLKMHHELIELIALIGRADEYDQAQVFRCLDARRGAEPASRHIPVRLELPARISTAGLFGAELAREGDVQYFRSHRWGRHAVEIAIGSEPRREHTSELRVRVDVTPAGSAVAELSVAFSAGRAGERFARACRQALVKFSGTSTDDPVIATHLDLEIGVQWMPGTSPAYAYRRGVTFLLEVLAAFDEPEPTRAIYFHAPGIGSRDLAEVQAAADARHPGITFVWIDPETDFVQLNLAEGADESLAYGAMDDHVVQQYERDPRDPIAGRFGLSPTRNGRSISATVGESSVRISVQALDDRPVRGYVDFRYSVPTRVDRLLRSTRVRASEGVAYCDLERSADGFAIGAIIEDEGVVLEVHLPAPSHRSDFNPVAV